MNLIHNKIKIGAEKPFHFLHMSDTHFALADDRDDKRKNDLAKARSGWYSDAEKVSSEIEAFAKENHLTIAHTGDYIDFVSEANLDRLKKFTEENDVFMAAGNHEFSLYVGEAFEDADYRNLSLEKVQSCVPNNIRFDSRKINGVNLIAIDNGYYLFDREQMEALKREAEYGLPMILFMHTPLYDEELYQIMGEHGCLGVAAYMVATPEELMKGYSKERYRQQKADEITLETVEYIKNQPLIKAIFCGHLHDFVSETKLTDGISQYVSNFENVRLVEVE
ncbi:MAG: metallophosphoesterase [Clostridia bacterium]|nr:metallophosphoesterase [Clostridia bacterium]